MNTADSPDRQPRLMKALRAHARGGPEQLVYEDAPLPPPPTGSDVCVRVTAAAVTFDELTWPETWESDGVDRTPIIPSHEFAGVVAAVGPDVHDFSIGDEVFGLVPFDQDGAAAEYFALAGEHARRIYANADALANFQSALRDFTPSSSERGGNFFVPDGDTLSPLRKAAAAKLKRACAIWR